MLLFVLVTAMAGWSLVIVLVISGPEEHVECQGEEAQLQETCPKLATVGLLLGVMVGCVGVKGIGLLRSCG